MPSPQRLSAIEQIQLRGSYPAETAKPLDELWGKNVFTLEKMKKALPKEEFKLVQRTIREGGKLDPSVATAVAQAMRVINARGKIKIAALRKTCANVTPRTRCNMGD